MRTWKDTVQDALLGLLVISSLLLSFRVWYSPHQSLTPAGAEPSVKPSPAAVEGQMPDVFRPERVRMRMEGNSIAVLHPGMPVYDQVLPVIQEALTHMRAYAGAFPVEGVPDRLAEGPWIDLRMPTALTLNEWAAHWPLMPAMPRNGSAHVDRVTLYLGEPGAVYVDGPLGITMYLADLPEANRLALERLMTETVPPEYFVAHRSLDTTDLAVRVEPDLLVSTAESLPAGRAQVTRPDLYDAEARFFPDLSVIRQIDERTASSLTDGQRLLRISATGILEYRTANPAAAGHAPTLQGALSLTETWVQERGGWPQDLVLRRHTILGDKVRLEFDLCTGDPYPVESEGAAIEVQLTDQRLVYFSRYPTFTALHFLEDEALQLISPEEAIARLLAEKPSLGDLTIRSVYLAYVAVPDSGGGDWPLEPHWVIQAGETRHYVPAASALEASGA